MVVCLLSLQKALGLIPRAGKKERKQQASKQQAREGGNNRTLALDYFMPQGKQCSSTAVEGSI